MSSAAEFLKTEARLRTLACRLTTNVAESVWQLVEDLRSGKRTIADLSDEELQTIAEYGLKLDGVDYTTLSDEELERYIDEGREVK